MSVKSLRYLFASILFVGTGIGCGANQAASHQATGKGSATVHADALTFSGDLNCLRATASQGGAVVQTIDLGANPNGVATDYQGTFSLLPGGYDVVVNAYTQACADVLPDTAPVGTGNGTVVVEAGLPAQLNVSVYDTTGGVPSTNPVQVLALSMSNSEPRVGDSVVFTLTAVELNGAPLTVTWTDVTGCGHFDPADPTGFLANWVADAFQACTIQAVVTNGTDSKTATIDFTVLPGPQPTTLDVTFVHNPTATNLVLGDDCTVAFGDDNVVCAAAAAVGSTTALSATFAATQHDGEAATFNVSCFDNQGAAASTGAFAGAVTATADESVTFGYTDAATGDLFVTPDLPGGFCIISAVYTSQGQSASIVGIRRIATP
jgi:hypothetical protein